MSSYKFGLILLVLFLSLNCLYGQITSSGTWSLTSDQSAVTTGNVNASDQQLVNMQAYYSNGVQRSSPSGTAGSWPGESDENPSRWMQFAVSPIAGNIFTVTNISLYLYVNSGSGMRANIYYSKDSTFALKNQIGSTYALSSTAPGSPNIVFNPNLNVNSGETIYVRIYPWYISSTTSKYTIANSVTISGETNSTTSIQTTENLLSGFVQYPGNPSNVLTYQVSGSNLTHDVIITPPSGFEISTDGGTSWNNYTHPVTLTLSGGQIAGQPVDISVRLNASVPAEYSGDILHQSTDAPDKYVNLSGVLIADEPTLQSSITFGEISGNSIDVHFKGGNGSNRIVVARQGSAVDWSPEDGKSYNGVSNNFLSAVDRGNGNKIVYDGSDTSIVVNSLTSNTSYYFSVYEYNNGQDNSQNYLTTFPGTGNISTLAVPNFQVIPSILSFGTYAANKDTAVKSYTLSGSYLNEGGGTITISAPAGFEVSFFQNSGFASSINTNYTGNSLADTTVYVKFIPAEVKNYTGNIIHSGGGATLNLAVYGVGVTEVVDVNSPVGFASLGGGTTGGEGGDTITVSSAQQIADIMKLREKGITTPLTIYISGTLSGYSTEISVKRTSNISILGLGTDAQFLGFGMKIVDCKNIIVRNIFFSDCKVDEKDAISVDGSINVWVDHCTFTDSPSNDPNGSNHDGLVDVKNSAYNVTISYNHFMNHRKTCLLGHTTNQISDTTMKVTYFRNWFDGTYSRHPRIRFAKAHLLNNYYTNIGGYGVGVTCQAQVMLEKNYFENTAITVLISGINDPGGTLSHDPPGFIKAIGNYAESSGTFAENTSGFNFDPHNFYSYPDIDVNTVKEIVQQNAGAGILNITTPVEKSNSIIPATMKLEQNYPNPFNPSTKIGFSISSPGFTSLVIYDILGKEIKKLVSENLSSGSYSIEFNASGLTSGIYFYRLTFGSFQVSRKMILLK